MPDDTIGIIDYGMGNLRSVAKAIEHFGATVTVGDHPRTLRRTGKLILPGVGAFGAAMAELKKRNLITLIKDSVQIGKPILGICLGLQLFFERSEESPRVKGLGIWRGSVVRFPATKTLRLKIPQMGWNQVRFCKRSRLMAHVKDNSYFYFVHSYYAKPADSGLIVGEGEYGVSFPAVLAGGSVFAVQFHPEKSEQPGLEILKNFIRL